jgi:hypothetical protein
MVDITKLCDNEATCQLAMREAREGDPDFLFDLVLNPHFELTYECRVFLVGLARGEINIPRKRGRPRKKRRASDCFRKIDENLSLARAIRDVYRLKHVWRTRYGRKKGIVETAIELAAKRRGVSDKKIREQLKMSQRDPRKLHVPDPTKLARSIPIS